MTLLDLADKAGLRPYRASSTQGGEYKSSCPNCGGRDRFFLQPNKSMKNCTGYYRCRKCDKNGDAIQFAIDFLKFDFKQAAELVGAQLQHKERIRSSVSFPGILNKTSQQWKEKAAAFVEWAHNNIKTESKVLAFLESRGLPLSAIDTYKIGWCPRDIRRDWGGESHVWLPQGIVIPWHDSQQNLQRIKIRREASPKYVVVAGSSNGLGIIGDKDHEIMVVVESELDAYAIHHAVGDYVFAVAVGSNIKKPDNLVNFLAQKKEIILCHDNDEGGNVMLEKWKQWYPALHAYPTPLRKDIGDAIVQGLKIRPWILQHKWQGHKDQELIDYTLRYISERIVTRHIYKKEEQTILDGPTASEDTKKGAFQNNLRLMRHLIEGGSL